MGLFDHSGTSVNEADVVSASYLARAAYKGNPVPSGWDILDATDLSFKASYFGGTFDGYYFNSGALAPGGSAIVATKGSQLVISFRGTDDNADVLAYATLGGNSYIDRFAPLLDAVGLYLGEHSEITQVIVTGHSLGAAAANILRDVSLSNARYAAFSGAEYITFAAPKIAVNTDIVNIGFENDGIYKYISGYKDFLSTNDNIVVFDDAYASSTWPGIRFDLGDTTVHGSSIYTDVVTRISGSVFYDEMTTDSVVVVVNTNLTVTDKAVKTSNHYGQPAYYVGRDGAADKVVGGAAGDTVEGFGGNDNLQGNSGNDRLLAGAGQDWIDGGDGADLLIAGLGSDTITGGAGNDTIRFDCTLDANTNVDIIKDFDVNSPGVSDSYDTIELENAIFTLLAPGELSSAQFACVANQGAADNGGTITYVTGTGGLYYDTNGAADGSATQFATLAAGLALTSADFFVV